MLSKNKANKSIAYTRIAWIDYLRAFGILLIVLAHNSINQYSEIIIFSFHIPLFFFISGVLFNPSKYNSFISFFKERTKSLLAPYLSFAMLTYIFWILIGRKFGNHQNTDSLLEPLCGIVYSNVDSLTFNRPLWFLSCLFVTVIAFWGIHKTPRQCIIVSLFLISLAGYINTITLRARLPWNIDVATIAIGFYGAGYLLKKHVNTVKNFKQATKICLIILMLPFFIFISLKNGRVDMAYGYYNNIAYYYLASFSGIGLLVLIATVIVPVNNTLKYIGQNSIIILGFHNITASFVMGVQVFVLNIPLAETNNSFIIGLIYTFCQIVLLVPVIFCINNYFPFLIGRFK